MNGFIEFICKWWPLLLCILLGIITDILWELELKKDKATSLGRLPDDPDDVIDRLEYKGRKYVKMWPSGACFTESFYNRMRPDNKKEYENADNGESMKLYLGVNSDATEIYFQATFKKIL